MTRPELGIKRRCLTCEAAFFDLKKDPILCVKCGAVFQIVELPRSPPRRAAVQMNAAESVVPATADDVDAEETSDDAAGEESILALPDEDDENETLEGIVPLGGDDEKIIEV